MEILYPVILPIPRGTLPDRPKGRNAILSHWARCALRYSALCSGADEVIFEKNDQGRPLPTDGWHWSVTHKPAYVAGLVASHPVGIDLEEIRPCREALIRKTASEREWCLLTEENRDIRFIKIWTAKEAVLKAEGSGIRGLNECKIVAASDNGLTVRGQQGRWKVEHFLLHRHVAAVARGSQTISWTVKTASSSHGNAP